jgi:hypothetical protein
MDKEFLVQLTKKLYHLTVLFPKKEPLRCKMRELALEILKEPDEQDLAALASFFEVAKDQNWVKSEEIAAIATDYTGVALEVAKSKTIPLPLPKPVEKLEIKPEEKPEEKIDLIKPQPLTAKTLIERQEKIMTILKEKGKAQVWEMKQIFPQISKRTLRRDFEFLLKQGIVQRVGERNNTFYQVKLS